MQEKIGWYAHPAFESWAEPFEEKYQMIDMLMIGDPAYSKSKTRKKEGRHCIFCDKSYPEVPFEKAAHLLSKMIGNKDLYSTFECDLCNNKFSHMETDLSYFLGLGRSFAGMNENRKPPGYPGIGAEAKSLLYKGRKLLIIHNKDAQRNVEEGSTKIAYHKPTYVPANVYKAFLKCALSVLPREEVINDYRLALKHLQGKTVLGGAHANVYRFPASVNMPLHVYIFKRKPSVGKLPVYVASFYFTNLLVSFPVLLHQEDLKHINQTIEIPVAPPYFIAGNDLETITPRLSRYDLSSPLKLKNEEEIMTLQFNKADLEKAMRFDPITGEATQTSYNPSGSKYFIATDQGAEFTKEELKDLINEIDRLFSKDS